MMRSRLGRADADSNKRPVGTPMKEADEAGEVDLKDKFAGLILGRNDSLEPIDRLAPLIQEFSHPKIELVKIHILIEPGAAVETPQSCIP